MALQNSGAISLDDIHVEAGGTTGTSASINDSDIRGLIDKSDGATASFNEYYGASSDSYIGGTGGQTTTSGNYKFHYFNSSGTLSLSSTGAGAGSNTVDYGRLTAVLIEAVKELSELVNRDITSIKKDIDAICQHPLWQENQMKGE